jgi:hypothetical protein
VFLDGSTILDLEDDSSILNEWYHLAVVRSNNLYRIYVDGSMTKEELNNTPLNLSASKYCIFGSILSSIAIDEIKFYNRPLSPEEIRQDYQLNEPLV